MEEREPSYTVGRNAKQPLWRSMWRFLKKLEIELPYDPAIPLLGIPLKKTEMREPSVPTVHRSTVYNS